MSEARTAAALAFDAARAELRRGARGQATCVCEVADLIRMVDGFEVLISDLGEAVVARDRRITALEASLQAATRRSLRRRAL